MYVACQRGCQRMIVKIGKNLKRLLRYIRAIDVYSGCLCILDVILNREVVRALTINGYHIHIRTNSRDLDVAISSFYEREYEYITLSDPKTIVDAGANIGTSSIFFATKYPDARIYAIEPEAGNYELLRLNTRNYGNIIPIHAAIWGEKCTRSIQNRFTGHWGYTVSETANESTPTGQEIICLTIKSLINKYRIKKIDLLKMDIEGGEKNVLENSKSWIGHVDTMTVELHDRICMGCDRAFYLATKDFVFFEKNGEKVTAYR